MTGLPRTATAIAQENSTVRVIPREQIKGEIDKLSPWVGGVVSALTDRLVKMNVRLLELEDRS